MTAKSKANETIVSPCIKLCAVDGQTGLCLGCGRSLVEIGGWVQMGAQGRDAVMQRLPERLQQLRAMGKLGE